ncbi:HTH-type transcriptional regulator [Melia azedarach]|uniref:HTH-type transcriptional regulator n=1 Tax=Melia azedarach TaxID=155640 RepID=A0ACC1XYD3_MELAZ|nr:HTH-type transcriptional regulator [Melia azedarach]
MGNCAAPQYRKNGVNYINWPATAKIIHLDGRLQEFRQPIKAGSILSENPNCFLCCSESMYIGSQAPRLPEDEELQLGQIYFLMRLSKSQFPLTLQELCSLAIKASSALSRTTSSRNVTVKYQASRRRSKEEVPIGFLVPARGSSQRIN